MAGLADSLMQLTTSASSHDAALHQSRARMATLEVTGSERRSMGADACPEKKQTLQLTKPLPRCSTGRAVEVAVQAGCERPGVDGAQWRAAGTSADVASALLRPARRHGTLPGGPRLGPAPALRREVGCRPWRIITAGQRKAARHGCDQTVTPQIAHATHIYCALLSLLGGLCKNGSHCGSLCAAATRNSSRCRSSWPLHSAC
jgi:hypothetical protein